MDYTVFTSYFRPHRMRTTAADVPWCDVFVSKSARRRVRCTDRCPVLDGDLGPRNIGDLNFLHKFYAAFAKILWPLIDILTPYLVACCRVVSDAWRAWLDACV